MLRRGIKVSVFAALGFEHQDERRIHLQPAAQAQAARARVGERCCHVRCQRIAGTVHGQSIADLRFHAADRLVVAVQQVQRTRRVRGEDQGQADLYRRPGVRQ